MWNNRESLQQYDVLIHKFAGILQGSKVAAMFFVVINNVCIMTGMAVFAQFKHSA